MITFCTYGLLRKTKICKDAIGIECNMKKVLCSAEKSSVIWAEPHSRSSAEQFGRTERSVYHYQVVVAPKCCCADSNLNNEFNYQVASYITSQFQGWKNIDPKVFHDK